MICCIDAAGNFIYDLVKLPEKPYCFVGAIVALGYNMETIMMPTYYVDESRIILRVNHDN